MTCCKFRTEELLIFGAAVQNLVALDLYTSALTVIYDDMTQVKARKLYEETLCNNSLVWYRIQLVLQQHDMFYRRHFVRVKNTNIYIYIFIYFNKRHIHARHKVSLGIFKISYIFPSQTFFYITGIALSSCL